MKDRNILEQNFKIQSSYEDYKNFMEILRGDTQFFVENGIIDYSLLLGIHNRLKQSITSPVFLSSQMQLSNKSCLTQHFDSPNQDCRYVFGIIDILTNFK